METLPRFTMNSTAYRQVDIDQFDLNSPVNQLPEVVDSKVLVEDISAVNREVKSLLASGNGAQALKTSISHPPYGSTPAVKEAALDTVLHVLASVRNSEIDGLVSQLSPSEQTVLVKYLFKASGSSKGQAHGTALLNWMERTFAIAGQGAIMKHITDRRTV